MTPTASPSVGWRSINWPVLVAALVLLVGFFVPWIRLPDGDSEQLVSGASMGVGSILAIMVGISLLAWGLFEIARFLFLQTSWGLWVTVGGAMLAAFGGALTWRRAHMLVAQAQAAAKAAKDVPKDAAT